MKHIKQWLFKMIKRLYWRIKFRLMGSTGRKLAIAMKIDPKSLIAKGEL